MERRCCCCWSTLAGGAAASGRSSGSDDGAAITSSYKSTSSLNSSCANNARNVQFCAWSEKNTNVRCGTYFDGKTLIQIVRIQIDIHTVSHDVCVCAARACDARSWMLDVRVRFRPLWRIVSFLNSTRGAH